MSRGVASIPGGIQIRFGRLIRFRPALLAYTVLAVALLAGAAAIAVLAGQKNRGLAALPAIIGVVVLLRLVPSRLALDRMRFAQGMLLPGLVADTGPVRIAMLSDMGKGDGRRYDVLAVRSYAAAMFDGDLKKGDRVPLCAVYSPGRGAGAGAAHWVTFLPEPVQAATGDAAVVREALGRIPAAEWAALESALRAYPSINTGATLRVDVSAQTGEPSGWPPGALGTDLGDGKYVG
jgi:hypothetical protein